MSLQDSLFSDDVEYDVTIFTRNKTRKRALIFPPVNNYRRYIIHQLVQNRFPDLLHTFSIGQGSARRTVVCYKSDVIRYIQDCDSRLNAPECKTSLLTKERDGANEMGIENGRSSPEHSRLQRQVKSVPAIEIYRPPAARRATNCSGISGTQSTIDSSSVKNVRQRRPDRAVYVPRHRRSFGSEKQDQRHVEAPYTNHDTALKEDPNINTNNNFKLQDSCCIQQTTTNSLSKDPVLCNTEENHSSSDNDHNSSIIDSESMEDVSKHVISSDSEKTIVYETHDDTKHVHNMLEESKNDTSVSSGENEENNTNIEEKSDENIIVNNFNENTSNFDLSEKVEIDNKSIEISDEYNNIVITQLKMEDNQEHLNSNNVVNKENKEVTKQRQNIISDVLIISDNVKESEQPEQVSATLVVSPEKKAKKIKRQKSKPAPPPSPPLKINRDECDWDSLFDDNGDCLDPTLIEELTSAVGEVMIEQPKNDYKPYSKQIEVSSDEFAHVVEIYNFPSEFKTSDLAAVFSPFKNGGFELKWVDDTHCLGVFSSPLIAAEVLASNHPFVKTRSLSEATALSKTKVRRSAEFLQPYRNRPETCAALARRLVTGALGVKLATARQEREHEKNVLREAKEKRRLANKQREDVWEGIIPEK